MARAELDENGRRIDCWFPYEPSAVEEIKRRIGGAKYRGPDKGGPKWSLPLELATVDRLGELFRTVEHGPRLAQWRKETARNLRALSVLASSDDADLETLPKLLPRLCEYVSNPLYRYQRADVAMMALGSCLNANQPGMGKTAVVPGAAAEAGLLDRAHLVIPPVTSSESVWGENLRRYQPHPVFASEDLSTRKAMLEEAERLHRAGEPFWLVVNADMLRWEIDPDREPTIKNGKEVQPRRPRYPFLFETEWGTATVDEFQMMGLGNPRSFFADALYRIRAERRWALSGTPMGGKPLRLWGILHWLDPDAFSSRWNWALNWCRTKPSYFSTSGLEILNEIRPEREKDFWRHHAPWIIRRLRSEYLHGTDPIPVDVPVKMSTKQEKQYREMERMAEVRIADQRLVAKGVLAEYGRLKMFADCRWDMNEAGELLATADSGKFGALLERLAERGIAKDEPLGEKAIVATQFTGVVEQVVALLAKNGIRAAALTGATKNRSSIIADFQSESDLRVIVMTTKTGGVSINLNRGDSVHILDETWDPDDQEQVAGRPNRGERTSPVHVYTYRTEGTIEQDIRELGIFKTGQNRTALDTARKAAKRRRSNVGATNN